MIDHFAINVADTSAAAAFHDKVLGYGTEGPDVWISTFEGIGPNRGDA